MEGKIHLHTKTKGTSFLIKHQKIQAKLERKKKKIPIRHSQPISHTLT